MRSLIKSSSLHNSDISGEYLIEPKPEPFSSHRKAARKTHSPEDAARQIILQAEEKAGAIIATASAEADGIRSAAYEEGYREGLNRLESGLQALVEQAANIEMDAQRQIEDFWTSIEPDLLKLAVEIAGKIVRKNIEENDEFVVMTVKEGLRQLRERQDLRIRVNPSDYELVHKHKDDIISSCDGIRTVEVIDDRRVDRGGCVIESGNGYLDARIETQFNEVEKALMDVEQYGNSQNASNS